MKYTELRKNLDSPAFVYLLQGEDAYFRQCAERDIKAKFLELPELNFASFEGSKIGDDASWNEFLAAVEAYPFMAERRIVKVSEFYPTEADYKKRLAPLLAAFPETTILIVSNASDKKGALKGKPGVTFVDCAKADRDSVVKWIYGTMKRAGRSIEVDAAGMMADWCSCDMARVSMETKKLVDYEKDGPVTREDIENLIYKGSEYRSYELTGTIAYRRWDDFCLIEDDMLRHGYDEMYLLNTLLGYFKNVSVAAGFRGTDAELASLLGIPAYPAKKTREQAQRIGEQKGAEMEMYLYDLVSSIKAGRITADGALSCANAKIFSRL